MIDHFDRLGMPRRFALDLAELERQYLIRSKALHPDYHATGPTAELAVSLEQSAAINESYISLRNEFKRADHLLMLEGGPSATEYRQMPQTFLAEILELRELVEQARAEITTNALTSSRLMLELMSRYNVTLGKVGAAFEEYEATRTNDPNRLAIRQQIRTLLNAATYIHGLIRDLDVD